MKAAEYDALVERLEVVAVAAPVWYRMQVVMIVAFGYVAVLVMLLAGLGLIGTGVYLVWDAIVSRQGNTGIGKLAAIMVVIGCGFAWAVLRAIWVRFPFPDGIVINRSDAPELFDEVERLRTAADAPAIHRLVIDRQFNARMSQRPRLGFLGWHQNVLVLGLPLLRQLTVEQARSVIAHELGHLRGRHGRFGAWIYRLRAIWAAIGQGRGAWLMRWYGPLFSAYSFVLARQQEREADRAAAMAGGAEAAGMALLRSEVAGRQSQRFWDDLRRRNAREAEPPGNLLTDLDHALSVAPPEAARWLGEALTRSNNRRDPHPCLRERLEIIGCAALGRAPLTIPSPPGAANAARVWLAACERNLAQRLNDGWRSEVISAWYAGHQHGQAMLARRSELEPRSAELGLEERWELVALIRDLDGITATLPQVQALLAAKPDHAPALFMLGSHLLDEGDARGVPLIEQAMALDQGAVAPGCELIRDFADAYGRRDLVRTAEERGEARAESEAKAAVERAKLPSAKRLQPHDLSDGELAPLRAVLEKEGMAWADLAAVAVDHLPERRHFLIAIRIKASWWNFRSEEADLQVIKKLAAEISLPGTFFAISGSGKTADLAKKAAKMPGARVYERKR